MLCPDWTGAELEGMSKIKTRFTPYYIQLVYDACLKSFWRKNALVSFLRGCDVPDTFIASWSGDETKRVLLDRIFEDLLKTDEGRKIILKMSLNLMEQKSFPDLENWEDAREKLAAAKGAVQNLRKHHREQEKAIQDEEARHVAREHFRDYQQRVACARHTLDRLNKELTDLVQGLGTQQAGYDFQVWFYDLVDYHEVTNRRPYVSKGRQIDGSITISGTTYLVELKFTSKQAQATDIDSLHKKVVNKADNTMGVMVSMSGYSGTAILEASGPKTPLLLLDYSHIYLILGGSMGFADVVNRVRRHASQTGDAYLSVGDFGG